MPEESNPETRNPKTLELLCSKEATAIRASLEFHTGFNAPGAHQVLTASNRNSSVNHTIDFRLLSIEGSPIQQAETQVTKIQSNEGIIFVDQKNDTIFFIDSQGRLFCIQKNNSPKDLFASEFYCTAIRENVAVVTTFDTPQSENGSSPTTISINRQRVFCFYWRGWSTPERTRYLDEPIGIRLSNLEVCFPRDQNLHSVPFGEKYQVISSR